MSLTHEDVVSEIESWIRQYGSLKAKLDDEDVIITKIKYEEFGCEPYGTEKCWYYSEKDKCMKRAWVPAFQYCDEFLDYLRNKYC
jgi:hypothetical protein